MPQFDLANFVPQLVWLAIFFAILYFGIVKLTLPKLGKVMNERETKVGDDIASAERAKHQADEIAQRYEAGIAEAQGNARAAVTAAKAEVARSVEQQLSALAATLTEKQAAADAALAAARGKAMAEIETVAAEAAAEIVERLTGKRPSDAETSAAASKALESA
jgi:F-type H+-transporting ATPase subunit b